MVESDYERKRKEAIRHKRWRDAHPDKVKVMYAQARRRRLALALKKMQVEKAPDYLRALVDGVLTEEDEWLKKQK